MNVKVSARTLIVVFNTLAEIGNDELLIRVYHESGEEGRMAARLSSPAVREILRDHMEAA